MIQELAIWSVPGQQTERGRVVKRGKSSTALVHVAWDNGRLEKVKPDNPEVKFAFEGSEQLRWILSPDVLTHRFKDDAESVFTVLIKEQDGPISGTAIQNRLVGLGLARGNVAKTFEKVRAQLKANRHILSKGPSFEWSDVEIDPYADLRSLPPNTALERLLYTPRLKPPQKEALADAIRAGFR